MALSLIRKWRTAGEPLLAHALLHSFTSASIPPSPLVSRALARGSARCLRLASVFASRVRAHGNLGLAGVCARVGRPGRWRHPSRTRYPRACPHPVAREMVINKVYYASATRHRDAPTALSLSATRRNTRGITVATRRVFLRKIEQTAAALTRWRIRRMERRYA